jgi:PAS domain-containing protein
MIPEPSFFTALLDALDDPILAADRQHRVIYMNQAAIDHYSGGESLIGTNLLDCHNRTSQEMMKDILEEMLMNSLKERLISEHGDRQVYMCAIRDERGRLLGYFEKFKRKSSAQDEP